MQQLEMDVQTIEVKTDPAARHSMGSRIGLIFTTGVSEIKRKGTVTRLYFEIKGLEREKEKFVHPLGVRAWEAHVHHPDLAGILVNLKELQIEMNRLKTQFGEHDTEIGDIDHTKAELTEKFNKDLDLLEQAIVPHRERIEKINAEKESNKVQIEELRSQQDHISQQIRLHQQSIQEFDLGSDANKETQIRVEQEAIRSLYLEKADLDCKLPFLQSTSEKLKIELANEHAEIERGELNKETSKRDFEQRIKGYNEQIQHLEDKKKQLSREMEHYRREMQPFLFDLGKKVEQLRLEEDAFHENYEQLDAYTRDVQTRQKQIIEAESLSRAMDRAAWTKFLVFSGTMVALFASAIMLLLK
jgi:chromosome segregation ATPase